MVFYTVLWLLAATCKTNCQTGRERQVVACEKFLKCLWKRSNLLEVLEEVWILRAQDLMGFFSSFSSQTWESQFYDIWGYFTSAVQMLSSSSDASISGRTTFWGTLLSLPWLSVAVVVLAVFIAGCIISWKPNSLHSSWEEAHGAWLSLSFQANKPFPCRWAYALLSIWDEPWPFSPSHRVSHTLCL